MVEEVYKLQRLDDVIILEDGSPLIVEPVPECYFLFDLYLIKTEPELNLVLERGVIYSLYVRWDCDGSYFLIPDQNLKKVNVLKCEHCDAVYDVDTKSRIK